MFVKRNGQTLNQDPFGLGSLSLKWGTPLRGEPGTKWVFCFLGLALDDLGHGDTSAQGPSGLTGLGVIGSPGRCELLSRIRIQRQGSNKLTLPCALRPWLREAVRGKTLST